MVDAGFRRSEMDFKKAFWVQYSALLRSACNFDCGEKWESVRIANSIHILLGLQQKNHVPLVGRLGCGEMELPSTARQEASGNSLVQAAAQVVRNETGTNAAWIVFLEPVGANEFAGKPKISLPKWWDECVISTENCTLSRRTLVRVMRDKDGGAHFDELLNDKNYVAAANGSVSFDIKTPDGSLRPLPFLLECSMRQIATEVLQGLKILFNSVDWELRSVGVL